MGGGRPVSEGLVSCGWAGSRTPGVLWQYDGWAQVRELLFPRLETRGPKPVQVQEVWDVDGQVCTQKPEHSAMKHKRENGLWSGFTWSVSLWDFLK